MKALRRLAPVLISVILLAIIVGYAPWPQVGDAITDLHVLVIWILLSLSLLYYGLKSLRFWYMTRVLGIRQPLGKVMVSYLAAQPVSLLPAGEIYRSRMLERITDIPMRRSLPTFTMQGLMEGAAMAILALISTLAIGKLRAVVLILALFLIMVFTGIQRGYMATVLRLLNTLPFVSISRSRLREFSHGNQAMLQGSAFPLLLMLSIMTELVGVAIVYVTVTGLGGHINPWQAILTYIIPVIVGFISLLPGGLGVSEQSSIGILLLSGTGVTVAVAATLLIRVTIVGMGFLYGLITLGAVGIAESYRDNDITAKRA
jgi:uncharacterized protein (TIRG00374 family)